MFAFEEIQGEDLCCPFALTGQSLLNEGRCETNCHDWVHCPHSSHSIEISSLYWLQQASGKDSESHGSKRGELQNAQILEQAGQRIAEDWLQECGPLLKESRAHPLAVTA